METIKVIFLLSVIIQTNEYVDSIKIVYLNPMWKHNTASMLNTPKNMDVPCPDGFKPDTRNGVCRRIIDLK